MASAKRLPALKRTRINIQFWPKRTPATVMAIELISSAVLTFSVMLTFKVNQG
jgi:hypothetical protein